MRTDKRPRREVMRDSSSTNCCLDGSYLAWPFFEWVTVRTALNSTLNKAKKQPARVLQTAGAQSTCAHGQMGDLLPSSTDLGAGQCTQDPPSWRGYGSPRGGWLRIYYQFFFLSWHKCSWSHVLFGLPVQTQFSMTNFHACENYYLLLCKHSGKIVPEPGS